jgi:hypothetical protein
MKTFKQFSESQEKHAAIVFGRMNPPHIGHEKVVETLKTVAKAHSATPEIILSHSQDPKKNPLPPELKLKYAKESFPGIKISTSSKAEPTILHVAAKLAERGVTDLHVVAGSDRKEEMETLLNKYNGVSSRHGTFSFNSITVHSSGDRDPDSDGLSGASASKMREYISKEDRASFEHNLSKNLSKEEKDNLYSDMRKYMGFE